MPGVRAKNKVFFGGYVPSRLLNAIKQAAAKDGLRHNVMGYAMELVSEGLKRRRVKLPERKPVSAYQRAAESRFQRKMKRPR